MTVTNTTKHIVYVKDLKDHDIGVQPGTTVHVNNGTDGHFDMVAIGPIIIFQQHKD